MTQTTARLPVLYGTSAARHPVDAVSSAEAKLIGRAPKINDELVLIILRELKNGSTIQKACEEAGISKATFYIWKEVNASFLDAVDRARKDWTDALVDRGLDGLVNVQANGKEDSARVRKAECIARHTLEIASRLNPAYSAKQQTTSVNLNFNVDIDPVEMDKYR